MAIKPMIGRELASIVSRAFIALPGSTIRLPTGTRTSWNETIAVDWLFNPIFSILLVSLVLYQLSTNQAVEGFATVIILQLIIGSIIMLGLGLIGTYLAKVYEEVKQRPFFVTKETLKKE